MGIRQNKGYTMAELAMVLGIVAVSAAVIAPRMAGVVNAWELDTEVNKVKAKIRQVQQLAIAEQTNYRIYFNVGGGYYQITKDIGGGVYQNVEVPPYGNDVRATGTSISLPLLNTITFDQFGAPDPSFGGTIIFGHSVTGQLRSLVIRPVTGKVDVL